MSNISICIPRTLNKFTQENIYDVFNELVGSVSRVDIVECRDNHKFCKIFIHFTEWKTTEIVESMKQRLQSGETVKIVYDTPWYWKCVKNHSASHMAPKKKNTPKIVFDEEQKTVKNMEYSDA